MNKLVFSLLIIVTLFTVTGCSEKFDVAAPYKDITVVYSFLDRADTAHYVRIQKAFLDQNKNALVMAKEADSSFFRHLNVRINRIRISDPTKVVDTIHLDRVDLTTEGYVKEPGVFFTAPNYAYKFKALLDPAYFYRLIVTNLETGNVDSSIAPIIDDVSPTSFKTDVIDDAVAKNEKMDFSSDLPNQSYDISVNYAPIAGFSFAGYNSPVYAVFGVIKINWVDSSITDGSKTYRSFDFELGYKILSNNYASYQVKNPSFYSAIAAGMGNAPTNVLRLMDRWDITMYATTYDYYRYQQASLTQGVGLTGNEIHPTYTNIMGKNVIGLYTARGMHTGKKTLSESTIQAIKTNPIVTNMRVVGTVYH